MAGCGGGAVAAGNAGRVSRELGGNAGEELAQWDAAASSDASDAGGLAIGSLDDSDLAGCTGRTRGAARAGWAAGGGGCDGGVWNRWGVAVGIGRAGGLGGHVRPPAAGRRRARAAEWRR